MSANGNPAAASSDAPRILQSPAGMYFHIDAGVFVSLMAVCAVDTNTGTLRTVDGKEYPLSEKAVALWLRVNTATQPGAGLIPVNQPLRGL